MVLWNLHILRKNLCNAVSLKILRINKNRRQVGYKYLPSAGRCSIMIIEKVLPIGGCPYLVIKKITASFSGWAVILFLHFYRVRNRIWHMPDRSPTKFAGKGFAADSMLIGIASKRALVECAKELILYWLLSVKVVVWYWQKIR